MDETDGIVVEEQGTPATTGPTMATNYGKLREYDTSKETWKNYVERKEFFFIANGITDETVKRAILLSASGPETYNLCRSLCSPDNPSTKSYTELKELIKNHLNPTPNPISERFKFYSRYRQSNEKISRFMASLRQLTEHCNFGGTVNEMIRDRLVCGVNHKKIQQRLLSEGRTLTLERAQELALSIESAEKDSSEMTSVQSTQPTNLESTSFNEVNKLSTDNARSLNCFRCGGVRHSPNDCMFKDRECFFCKSKGHTMKVCRKRQASLKSNSPNNNSNNSKKSIRHDVNKQEVVSGIGKSRVTPSELCPSVLRPDRVTPHMTS